LWSLGPRPGGPPPGPRFLPELMRPIGDGTIDPGRVFDLDLPIDQAAEAYTAMNERRAIKALLRP
jgi:threonine dehydrogenase-like Zn-dependent dehydrogenase